ncbi:hypothetical protein [Nesterenkonia sp. NBAIMH1]|uniref:hypothetical protein n=1 Tax=Nesterenkonia sp. NBAIMH1 TaxID=2600320 RepID=UPI0011B61560|nr:hypothetical protein [Nesterenkonia sp. NBAIMH1]
MKLDRSSELSADVVVYVTLGEPYLMSELEAIALRKIIVLAADYDFATVLQLRHAGNPVLKSGTLCCWTATTQLAVFELRTPSPESRGSTSRTCAGFPGWGSDDGREVSSISPKQLSSLGEQGTKRLLVIEGRVPTVTFCGLWPRAIMGHSTR